MHKVRNASILIAITLIAVLIFVSFISGVEKTARISTKSSGAQVTDNASADASITYRGDYVAFESLSETLVTDTNNAMDIFKKDVKKGTMTRVSTNTAGTQVNGASMNPAISGSSGRFVAFQSDATNLISVDANSKTDIFRKDTSSAGTTILISANTTGVSANGNSANPSITGGGSITAYESDATDLIAAGTDTNNKTDIFVRGTSTSRISTGSSGTESNNDSNNPSIAAINGRYVAFESTATNLITPPGTATKDIYRKDTSSAGTTILISADTAGGAADGASSKASISGEGRYVAFQSDATDLITSGTDTNNKTDIFVKDTVSNTTTRVSLSSSGAQATGASTNPSISTDGRHVAFESAATDLVTGDANGAVSDIFIKDTVSGTITRLSTNTSEVQSNAAANNASTSRYGQYVAYDSTATNLVSGDTNALQDVFLATVDVKKPSAPKVTSKTHK
ncbi:hypothetical protein LCGC14_2359410, partial [marine sediment metagenome]